MANLVLQEATAILNEERERRYKFYDDITEDDKIEFINGEITVHSPVTFEHNVASGLLYRMLSIYCSKNKLGFVGVEKIMITLSRNDYEPDLSFFRKNKAGTFDGDQKLFPAPDFVVEILSESTQNRDRGIKFKDYQGHGVEEYWIIDPEKRILEQYLLKGKEYELVLNSSNGTVASPVIDGFTIPIQAIFDEDENLKTILSF
ncbi:Uma2 family endonuclease [Dyadobacter sandarakinus]|nr:Uma2 family endonuclease [Dyadobacter sandarakinus]